jgi:two-component system, chemotaxis family, protein-glutamate methylesterase/glutaminase
VIKLLIVDDSPLMRRLLRREFDGNATFLVETARDGVEAMEKLRAFAPDVITLDLQMPHMSGMDCLKRIMLEKPRPVVIVSSLTEAGGVATLEAMQAGAVDFIAKPAGAMSLSMEEFGPLLRERVVQAASAKVPSASRLVERVRLRLKSVRDQTARSAPFAEAPSASKLAPLASSGGIVIIGCSTGGPRALDVVLTSLPNDFPWPIVIAQHMPATFTGPLARRLDQLCALNVREVVRTEPLEPGTALIARGDADVVVTRRSGTLVASSVPASTNYRWHPSVDRLVTSVMQHVEPSLLVGVLMTGMGNDGAEAMGHLAKNGGRTIAESEETAVVWGMPGVLVKNGGASSTLPLHKIASELCEWIS